MSIDFSKCRMSPAGNVITPKGRILYPALFKPTSPREEKDNPDKARYQISLLLPTAADLALLVKLVNEKIVDEWGEKWAEKYKVKKPFIRTEDQPKLRAYAEEFPVLIRTNSKDKPGLVGPNGRPIEDENEVYSGRWGCLSLRAYTYDHATGGKGVSLGLVNVQLLDHDDVLAGARPKAEDEFGAVEASKPEDLFN